MKKELEFVLEAESAIADARVEFAAEVSSCVAVLDGEVIFRDKGIGVSCLMRLYEQREKLGLCHILGQSCQHGDSCMFGSDDDGERADNGGLVIADKIVGKAAAMLMVLIGARVVFGEIMSEAGRDFLLEANVVPMYGKLVPKILNRTGDDYCPIEKSVLFTNSPHEGLANIRETIKILMAAKSASQS